MQRFPGASLPDPIPAGGACAQCPHPGLFVFMHLIPEKSFTVGRYRVSSLTQVSATGVFSAGVSIRSGQGQGTHDRVFRFLPAFSSPASARRYAVREGLAWIRSRLAPVG